MVCTTPTILIFLTFKAEAFIFLPCALQGHQLIQLSCVKIQKCSLTLKGRRQVKVKT